MADSEVASGGSFLNQPIFSRWEAEPAPRRSLFQANLSPRNHTGNAERRSRRIFSKLLGLFTASIFHLMRVMERGVQKFGKRLGIVLVGEKNWQNILDEINKAIKDMPDSPPTAKKKKAAFAAASANLFNVKLAWRNPVMHPKESYAPEEAAEIYSTVKRFMEHLATVL